MKPLNIILISFTGVLLFFLLVSFILFMLVFYSKRRKPVREDVFPVPRGKIYEPYHEQMREWVKESRRLEHTDVSIVSDDGLTLRGRYYHFFENAPIELMIHGYRGDSERDLSGGIARAYKIKHNALIVDQRASGRSDGHIITFGIKEHLDCLKWIDFIIHHIDSNAKILLTGISMGASTVLMASKYKLPPNVIGILADCGFTSAENIIKDILRKLHLSVKCIYPFIFIGAKIFGQIDLHKDSPVEAVRHATLPILFFHGDTDKFVPVEMSVENYQNCSSEKKHLVVTQKAGHGLCYVVDEQTYLRELGEFFEGDGYGKIRPTSELL